VKPKVKAPAQGTTVSAAYAKTNFGELLKEIKKGHVVTIERYNKPVAVLSPPPQIQHRRPQFGMVKGIKILDSDCAAPMTDEEVDEILKSRY